MVGRIVLAMVIVVVMVGGLFVERVGAQSADCSSMVDNVGQPQAALAALSYSDALASYTCSLEADPLNAVARIGRLQTALLMGDYLTAYGDVLLLNDGFLDAAIATQTEILAANPDNINVYLMRAFLYLFSDQPDIARADAGRILTRDSGNAFAYWIQAASSKMMGDAESAVRAFETAVKLDPDNAQLYDLMAVIVPMRADSTYRLEFQGWAGQIANIRATGVNPDKLDPLVQLISPSGRLLDFGSAAGDESRDTVLSGIEILEDGIYTLVLRYAPGSGQANIAVSLEQHWRRGPGIR